ncbi:hypothetical protein HJG43_06990 [Kineosporiaceae bacterium SCSIO 59966]|nr:hypothetical protein HJG43_06990 [Kineosporiaceae bacterium SCSIO 59966]
MATGLETGTTVVLDPFQHARGISDGGDAALLALAAVAIALGLWTAQRTRPRHSVRELRRLGALESPSTTTPGGRS